MTAALRCSMLAVVLLVTACGGSYAPQPPAPSASPYELEPATAASRAATATLVVQPTATPEATSSAAPVVVPSPPPATATPSPRATFTATATATATPTPEPTATPLPTPETSVSSGTGSGATEPLWLPVGPVVVELEMTGSGAAIARIVDAVAGKTVTLLANVQAPWSGSRVVDLPADGSFRVDIAAQGSWIVRIIRPALETVPVQSAPLVAEGDTSTALYYILLPAGEHAVRATHAGAGAFSITAHAAAGGGTLPVIRQIGPVEVETALTISGTLPALVLLDVAADGAWTLEID